MGPGFKGKRNRINWVRVTHCDLGAGYIGTADAYKKGGYEVSDRASNVAPEVEGVLMKAMFQLLQK
ncbi:MAG TPA: hypothetical protein VN038_28685 [Dyadobacter sp.]|nr:hypothetical protein [Dyadobacter sp.]